MPFGVSTAPAAFQRMIQTVLAPVLGKGVLVYIDDIIIYSRDIDEHLRLLRVVLQLLKDSNLTLKGSKCNLLLTRLKLLGHVVSSDGIEVDPDKVQSIVDFEVPKNVKALQRFLGMCTYYHSFICNFSSIALPLYELLRKDVKYEWSSEQQASFERLKECLMTAPILIQPDYSQPFVLVTDASKSGLGGLIGQAPSFNTATWSKHWSQLPDDLQPIAYCSKTLTPADKNLSATELEASGIIYALSKFRIYTYGQRLGIFTDHSALPDLSKKKSVPPGRLTKFMTILSEYNPRLHYIRGATNVVADTLSRQHDDTSVVLATEQQTLVSHPDAFPKVPSHDADGNRIIYSGCQLTHLYPTADDVVPAEEGNSNINIDSIKEYQENDEEVQNMIRTIDKYPEYAIIEGLLYHRGRRGANSLLQLFVPRNLRGRLMDAYHTDLLSGHLGIEKTFYKLRTKYFWPGYYNNLVKFIRSCHTCQRDGKTSFHTQLPTIPLPIVTPFERVGIDVLGPLPTSTKGNKYLVVLVDHGTHWPEAFPTPHTRADLIADLIFVNIICRYGSPKQLLSDRGSNFMSRIVQELCKIFEIKKLSTSAYHPQTNGQVERMNGTLSSILRKTIDGKQEYWDSYVPAALFAYRTAMHPGIQHSPFELMYGTTPRLPIDVMLEHETLLATRDGINYEAFRDQITAMRTLANELYAEDVAKRTSPPQLESPYHVGSKVWLYTPAIKIGQVRKLSTQWNGPYVIEELTSPVNAKIKHITTKKTQLVHVSRLKPYIDRTKPDGLPEDLRLDEALEDHEEVESTPTTIQSLQDATTTLESTDTDSEDEDPKFYKGTELEEIDKILAFRYGKKGKRRHREYLVSWKGHDESENSWEPASSFAYNPETVREFHRRMDPP